MAENILNQDEVNALLSAVDGGQVALCAQPQQQRRIRSYDFSKPSRISKENARVVRAIHENFAQLFSFSLSGFIRGLAHVEMVSVDQLTYNEFMLSLPEYTCLNIISMAPVKGNFIIEVNLNILLLFIERLLGGANEESSPIRPLTPLELTISSKIVGRLLECYRSAWRTAYDFTPRVERIETDPRFAQGVGMNEMVLLVCFEVRLGKVSGIINICFPMETLEPLLPSLAYGGTRAQTPQQAHVMERAYRAALLRLPLSVHSVLDRTKLPLNDVLALSPGDVIRLDKPASGAIDVLVGNRPVFEARIGARANQKIAVITRAVQKKSAPPAIAAVQRTGQ